MIDTHETKTLEDLVSILKTIGFDGAVIANHGWDLKLQSNLWLSHPIAYKQTPYQMGSYDESIELVVTTTERHDLIVTGRIDLTRLQAWNPDLKTYAKELHDRIRLESLLHNKMVELCHYKFVLPNVVVYDILNLASVLPEQDCVIEGERIDLINDCSVRIF